MAQALGRIGRGGRWPGLVVVALLALTAAVRAPRLGGPALDYDEGVYWQSLRAMGAGHRLYAEVFDSQPPVFLLVLHPLEALGGIAGARLGVLLLALAGIAAGFVAGRALAGVVAGLAVAAVLAADPLAASASVTLQAEGPALALALIAVALAADSRRRSGRAALVGSLLAGEAVALAVLTKLIAASCLVPVAVLLAVPAVHGTPRPAIRIAAGAAGLAGVMAVVLLPFAPDWGLLGHQVVGLHLDTARGAGGGVWTAVVRELPLTVLAMLGVLLAARRTPLLAVVAGGWLLATVAELLATRPVFAHHLVALVPPLALAAGSVAAALERRLAVPSPRRLAAAAAAAVVTVVLGSLSIAPTAELADSGARSALVAGLRDQPAAPWVLVTDDQYAAADAGEDVPPELVDTSLVRIATHDLDAAAVERAARAVGARGVLFATGRLDSLPGLRLWAQAAYPAVVPLPGGAVLYLRR